jgi:hypothetical protein
MTVAYRARLVGGRANRLAVFRSKDGAMLRYLTPRPGTTDSGLPSLTPNRKRVYFVRGENGTPCPGTYSVPLAGGTVRLERNPQDGGAQPIAVGPKGAIAGTYACLASQFIHVRAGNGKTYNINGIHDLGASGLSWAPDTLHLAVATTTVGLGPNPIGVRVLDVRKPNADLRSTRIVPCPAGLRGCLSYAPAYSPTGTLYYVVQNKARTSAQVVRLVAGKAVTVFKLPRVSAHFSLAVAAGGHVLASGDADSATMTRSDFVVRWDGKHRITLGRSMVQVDW